MRINHTCTAREMSIIRKYITGISYKLKMTQDELDSFHKIRTRKQLEKKSYEYIAKKLDIPSEILPPLVQVEQDKYADYSYAFLDNVIQAGIKLRTPKTEILSAIRHEFQHFLQICNMLRTEGLGSEAQKYLTQESIEDRKDFIKFFKISLKTDILGSRISLSQPHSPLFRFAPQIRQIPLQSSLHKVFPWHGYQYFAEN